MIDKILASLFTVASLLASPALCQSPDDEVAEVTVEEEDLLAFIQLGRFYDRGINSPIIGEPIKSNPNAQADPKPEAAVPQELLNLLKVREKNLSQERLKLPFLWFPEAKDPSPQVMIDRLRRHGLPELFLLENTQLLDSPLTQRKELMDRMKAIAKEIAPAWAALFTKHSKAKLLIVAGHLRTLSVELDMEIMNALTPDERARVAKLVSYLLPSAIDEAKKDNQRFELGSAIYGIERPIRTPGKP